jgi:hypothetical protein
MGAFFKRHKMRARVSEPKHGPRCDILGNRLEDASTCLQATKANKSKDDLGIVKATLLRVTRTADQ